MSEPDSDSQNEIKLSILTLIVALRGSFRNMFSVIWQPFVLSLGVSMQSLGGLESVLDISRLIVQPIIGGASDAQGRKRWLLIREFLTLTIGLLSIFAGSVEILLLIVIIRGIEGAIFSIWNALIAESYKAENLGYIFSILTIASTTAGLIATLSAGYIANFYGYRTVFVLSTILIVCSLALVFLKLPETKLGTKTNFRFREAYYTILNTLRPPRHLWGFYIAMSVDLFSFNIGWRLMNGMLTEAYGYSPQMLGFIATVLSGTIAISQIFISKFIDRIGYSKCLAISQIFACIFLSLIVYSKKFEVVTVGYVLMGIAAALWGPAENAWIASNVNQDERARAMASYSSIRTLASFPAPFLGGLIFDTYGFDAPILVNIGLAVVDVFLILWLIKDR